MSNSNIDALYPEFWAAAFDELNVGEYGMQNRVSRKYDGTLGQSGDTVNVPISVDFGDADDWTPGDSISASNITQTTVAVTLDKSKKKTINLTGKELSLSPYDLIQSYGSGMAKSLISTVNKELYKTALGSTYFVDARAGISEDFIADAGTKLSNNEISMMNRVFEGSPDILGACMKLDAFLHVDTTGSDDVMRDGKIARRFGFDFYQNNAFAKYTPADLAGAVNNAAGYAAGATTMTVDGFNDDTNPIRVGDIFVMAADSTSTPHTVTAVTYTSSDTTSITFSPGLVESELDEAVINFVATQSALCYVPSGIALAARPYAVLPEATGVRSSVVTMNGLPIRISVWHDGNLGVKVQYDLLFGTKLIDAKRVVRIVEDM